MRVKPERRSEFLATIAADQRGTLSDEPGALAFVVSCELIRLGWQESGCPLSQPGLLCFKEVGCL